MKIAYLKQARRDLLWWSSYYQRTFPAGKLSVYRRFKNILEVLKENPFAGIQVDETDLRRFPIPRTPFLIVYRVGNAKLEIVRVWDMRNKPLQTFTDDI